MAQSIRTHWGHEWLSGRGSLDWECQSRCDVWKFPFRVIGKGNGSGAIKLTAASTAHFNLKPAFVSRDHSFSAVCLTSTVNEVCSAVLLTGSYKRTDWSLGSESCIDMSVVQFTHPPFCGSRIWQDALFLFPLPPLDNSSFSLLLWARRFVCCLYTPYTHHPAVCCSADNSWQLAGWCTETYIFVGLPKIQMPLYCGITCKTKTQIWLR